MCSLKMHLHNVRGFDVPTLNPRSHSVHVFYVIPRRVRKRNATENSFYTSNTIDRFGLYYFVIAFSNKNSSPYLKLENAQIVQNNCNLISIYIKEENNKRQVLVFT